MMLSFSPRRRESMDVFLNPDFPVEQQFEAQSPSISFELLHGHHLRLLHQLRHQLWVDERYNQERCCLFNMFHNHKINAKKLGAALKSLEENYYYSGTDRRRFIHCGDVAGTSLSRLEGAGSSGYPSTSGYSPGTNSCGGGVPVGIGLVNNNGDLSSSVKHSPPRKGKVEEGAEGFANVSGDATGSMNAHREGDLEMGRVNNNGDPPAPGDAPYVAHTADRLVPHEEGAGGFANVSGDATGSMNAHREGDLEMGRVNNNGDPPAPGDVPYVAHTADRLVPHEEGAGGFANVSGDATGSMNAHREGDLEMGRVNNNGDPPAPGDVPYVAHTADRLGEYGVNVARTVFRVSVAAASRTTTSHFAKASYAIGFADSGVAILLADTDWKAATPILAKAGVVACGVGVLADMGKDLPLSLFIGAMTAAIFIIIAAMVFAKRLA